MPYTQTYTNLIVCCLDEEFNKRTCNYWYTVTSRGTAHTAFHSSAELQKWLDERGLKLTAKLPEERGTYKVVYVDGCYSLASYMDKDAFDGIVPMLTVREMSNGQYTLGKVTEEDGIRIVHYLNPNVKERIVF